MPARETHSGPRMRVAVLASGRGSNLTALLAAERHGRLGAEIALVASDRADAPALDRARESGKPAVIIDPGPSKHRLSAEAEANVIALLHEHKIDLIALAGFMRIVGRGLLAAFPNRVVNIHPSLLPAFPGLDAQRQAWEAGVRFAGCTVHFVNEAVDAGPIILQSVVPVLRSDSPESLAERILAREHVIYPQSLRLIAEGRLTISGRRVAIDDDGASWLSHD
ncbi:MAG: phosphoribosylglycinamide formyltransferase [bacterium]